jgi:hypothetical protein
LSAPFFLRAKLEATATANFGRDTPWPERRPCEFLTSAAPLQFAPMRGHPVFTFFRYSGTVKF